MRLRNRSGEYDPRFLLDNLNQGNFLEYKKKKKIYEQLTIIIFLLNKGDRISSSSQSSRAEGNFTVFFILFYFILSTLFIFWNLNLGNNE